MTANDNIRETWRKIPSLPEYLASSLGRIMRDPWHGEMPYGGIKHYGGTPTFGVWQEYCHGRIGDKSPIIKHRKKMVG